MIKKQHYGLILIILASASLNLLNSPLSYSPFDDKEIYKYGGLIIYKGLVPYRDFFDHKPPLIYFFDAINWFAGPWTFWLLDSLLIILTTVLLYWLCRKNKLAWPWFIPVIFNLLIRSSIVSFGIGLTREYTAAFLLIFFCVMQGNARYKYFILGLLAAFTGWMQQDSLITLAPFMFYTLFIAKETTDSISKRLLGFIIGFMTVSLTVLFYFASKDSLTYLWRDAFLFNLNSPDAHVNIVAKVKAVKHALHEAEFEMAFYTTLILGIICLFLRPKKPALLWTALLALLLSFAGEWISGRLQPGNPFIYYLIPLSATIPILLFIIFSDAPNSFLQDKTAQLTFYILISTTLLLGTLRYASVFRFTDNHDGWLTGLPEIEFLKTQALTDYQLYVFDDPNAVYLYNDHRILAPSRWIYHYFWSGTDGFDKDKKLFGNILNDLRIHKTKWILDCTGRKRIFKNGDVLADWNNFLLSNYSLLMKDSSGIKLWQIK